MRRLNPPIPLIPRIYQRLQRAGNQQRALNRILRSPCQKHLLNIQTQITKMRMRIIRQKNAHILNLSPAPRSKPPPPRVPIQHQRGRLQPICILQQKNSRILAMLAHIAIFFRLNMRHRSRVQLAIPRIRRPNIIPLQTLHRRNPRLPSRAALNHTLQRLQRVKTIRIQPTKSHRHRRLNLRIQIVLNPRLAPCKRKRRPRHKRHLKLPRAIAHPLRIAPIIRKMLIAKHRNRPPRRREHPANLFKKILARIHMLFLFIPGIITVLPNQQHPIHRQLITAQSQSLVNTPIHRHTELLCNRAPDIISEMHLIQIHRHHIHLWRKQPVICWKPLQKLRHNHIGM